MAAQRLEASGPWSGANSLPSTSRRKNGHTPGSGDRALSS